MASLEACWTVRFGPADDGGVAVLESGNLYGGDSIYAYLGTYDLNGDSIRGKLRIIKHNLLGRSIYPDNSPEFDLTFSVQRTSDDIATGFLKRAGYPDARITLARLADLP